MNIHMGVSRNVVSAANFLTFLRLLAMPVIVLLLLNGENFQAAIVFGAAAMTDFFDGFLARMTGTVSTFGKWFDPIVDRIFIAGVAVAVLFTDVAPPLWAVALLVARDTFLLIGFRYLRYRQIAPPTVVMTGKAATASLMTSLPVLMIWPGVGHVIFMAGLVFSLVAGFIYVRKGMNLLRANPV